MRVKRHFSRISLTLADGEHSAISVSCFLALERVRLLSAKITYIHDECPADIMFVPSTFFSNNWLTYSDSLTSQLITGGANTVNALTGMNTIAACFLIPIGVVIYTLVGGLRASTFLDTSVPW